MLPPIPSAAIPVGAQHDVVKPRPDIPPVSPVQPGASESSVNLDRRHPQEAEDMLREEQRRRQRRGASPAAAADDEPPADAPDELPRQGRWVDVEV